MRKIIRLPVLLLLAFVMGISVSGPAFALDSSVTFKDGNVFVFAPGSVDADTSLFDNFEGIMPGDVRLEEITVSNESSDFDYIKVYLRAVPLDETSQLVDAAVKAGETVASMKDFLSQLSMKVYRGTETIYDASPDQVEGLADNVYLGTLRKGESVELDVELEVPIDLDNTYANRVGEVRWTFVIEGFNETSLTVKKMWEDTGENRPESVAITLLRDGESFAEVELNQENEWTHTWDNLNADYTWSVVEKNVPEGYEVTYTIEENVTIIKNSEIKPEPIETDAPKPTETKTPEPTIIQPPTKTGEKINYLLPIVLLSAGVIALIITQVMRRRKK